MSIHDTCIQLLADNARQKGNNGLWLADDGFSPDDLLAIQPFARAVLTNRYHLYLAGQSALQDHHKAQVYYGDFDFSLLQSPPPPAVFYRVSKEKAVTHYLINQCFLSLPRGGTLHLCGYKNDGIKTYIDKARKLFGELAEQENGPRTARYAVLKKQHSNDHSALLLDDREYERVRDIFELDGLPVQSKPGIFGWNKQDAGSEFLIEHLQQLLDQIPQPIEQVLDLGCGYGYIALQAWHRYPRLQQASFTLTDNNAAAVRCASGNLKTHNIPGVAVDDDCGLHIKQQFDLILCNPPFHQGFDISQDITRRFLQSTRDKLKPQGRALYVVNQFVGIEKKATEFFTGISELARNKSFKLIVLDKPRR
ncbi:MAG: methyltransferase [Ketobacteraceae bacterium]|nr:methyltransferase [Ketobacteraceae bacterium]